jgi:uncharacterized membrane protein YiaA
MRNYYSKSKDVLKSFTLFQKVGLFMGCFTYLILFYKYKNQMGDFGTFVKAGELIVEGTDPYANTIFVSSPVPALFFYFLSEILPFIFIPIFWQVLNLFGLFYFFHTFLKTELSSLLPLVFAMLAFLNTTRALLANVQVSGLVLGLIAIGAVLVQQKRSIYLQPLPIWFALEIKPQFAIGFVLFLLCDQKFHFFKATLLTLYTLVSHFIVEVKYLSDINYFWLKKIMVYSSASVSEGYEISIWKALALYTQDDLMIRVFSTVFLLFLLVMISLMSIKSKPNWAIGLACYVPLLNSYLHLYDLIPIAVIISLGFVTRQNILNVFMFFMFLQVYPLGFRSQIIMIVLFLVVIIFQSQRKFNSKGVYLSALIFITFGILSYFLLMNQSEEVQIALTLVFPITVLSFINKSNFGSYFANARV